MKLYEIDQGILECVDSETGEIIDLEKLHELQMEREKKIEGIALWVKNKAAEAVAIESEINTLTARKKALTAQIEGLKGYLTAALNGSTFSTAKTEVKFRKSEAVVVEDETKIPEDYMNTKITKSPDKMAIKDALKHDIQIPGCSLGVKQNIQIK